jgi:hypothetical protein
MEKNWATEHLHVIRTLMERSALYRRALAPIMFLSGSLGTGGAIVGKALRTAGSREFTLFWMSVGVLTLGACLFLVRRQALKDSEPFWSVPTRRVAGGLLPCFLAGLAIALVALQDPALFSAPLLACLWILNYGCALRSAGFFMERGIKLFGGIFLAGGLLFLIGYPSCPWLHRADTGHFLMGSFFGLFHLGYGAYLYSTERKPES